MTLDEEVAIATGRIRMWVQEVQLEISAWDLRPCPDWYHPHEHNRP